MSHRQGTTCSLLATDYHLPTTGYRLKEVLVALRRGIAALVIALIGLPLLVFAAVVVFLYMIATRGPSVPDQATLVLRPGGNLLDVRPMTFWVSLRGATRRHSALSWRACAKPSATRASRQSCCARQRSICRSGASCRSFAPLSRISGSPESRSSRISSMAAIASTTSRARPNAGISAANKSTRSHRRRLV